MNCPNCSRPMKRERSNGKVRVWCAHSVCGNRDYVSQQATNDGGTGNTLRSAMRQLRRRLRREMERSDA